MSWLPGTCEPAYRGLAALTQASSMRQDPTNRRSFLKAAGATVVLPWLESIPILSAVPTDSALTKAPLRFVANFFPLGVNTYQWGASGVGETLEFNPTLEPLTPIKHKVNVLMDLCHPHLKDKRGHAGKVASLLTGEPGGRDNSAAGVSIDQLIAGQIGDQTAFRSLALGIAPSRNRRGFYDSSISWRGHLPVSC